MTKHSDSIMVNAFIPGLEIVPPALQALIDRRDRLLGPAYRLMYQKPLHIVRGEGVWLFDGEGKPYLDVYNNVTSLGHCHPDVVEALVEQTRTLATNTRYLHETILELAERLVASAGGDLAHLMLTCTGTEANDLAYRIAKVRTGGTGIIITETAYHGISDTVSQFSPSLGEAVNLGAHVRAVPAPSSYMMEGDVGETFTRDVKAAIADLQRHGIKPAMLIVDSLFTSDGILVDSPGFLKGAVEAIHASGALFVADEVQPGFGRTGTHMWGFQRHGVAPDIVTIGKPMGNGYPVAGLLTTHDAVEEFGRRSRYFSTFAGNTAACAAALSVLKVIERDKLQANALEVGGYMRQRLDVLKESYPLIGDVRGAGLFVGIEIVSDRKTKAPARPETAQIVNKLREHAVLISACGVNHNILKVRPPIIFTRENVDLLVDTLKIVLEEI